jgi:ribosomal subunit interface protein
MNVKIVFKNLEHTDALDSKIQAKVKTLKRFFEDKIDITWTCSVADNAHRSDVHLVGPQIDIHADATSNTLYETFDLVIQKVTRQLQKIKEQRRDRLHSQNQAELEQTFEE